MADRQQQLLLIALGESVLAVGVTYTTRPGTRYEVAGLLVAFATTVLLWRIYFYKAGLLLTQAVDTAADRAAWGRKTGLAHLLMVAGILATSIGHDIVQHHPTPTTLPSWLAMIIGGPALFVAARARLEHLVFARVSRRRLAGITTLTATTPVLLHTTPLVAAATATTVLLAIAALDARHAAGKPPETAAPPH